MSEGRTAISSEEFTGFLAAFFDLLSGTSPAKLRRYATLARRINPELQGAIATLATFSEQHLASDIAAPQGRSAVASHQRVEPTHDGFMGQVELLFRDEKLFAHNEDLMSFLNRRFGMQFGTSSYSRTSILKRFARHARLLTTREQTDLLDYLRTTNVQNGQAPKEHSFLRAWTDVIGKT